MTITVPGYYDLLITQAIRNQLNLLDGAKWDHEEVAIDEGDAILHQIVVHMASEVMAYAKEELGDCKPHDFMARMKELLQREELLDVIRDQVLPLDGKKLRRIKTVSPPEADRVLPDTPLGLSALLTGARHSVKLMEQIKKELLTCDRADWVVSFIRMTGINQLREALKQFTSTPAPDGGPRLRIATTTYLGVTEAKAIAFLRNLPHTQVRISYDAQSTRLHAKAYIFHRRTGFGTAYIGSSNVSKVAMDHGLEWNVKLSQHELGYLWDAVNGSFETHWADSEHFRDYQPDDYLHLRRALTREQGRKESDPFSETFFDISPYPYQQEALDAIARERACGKTRHLIVAATGTGKTMIAAFDFKRFRKEHPEANLLFVAHRKEILEQARNKFRQVLREGGFGEVVHGDREPSEPRHWFCTIQTWNARYTGVPVDHFDYVVLDEAHHEAADSYKNLTDKLQPLSLLGLTATPERMDGKSILPSFGGTITHELRLVEAIERRLLAPFVYYGLADEPDIDFSHLTWAAGRYKSEELDHLLAHNEKRAQWVMDQLLERVDDVLSIRALGFCVSIKHAHFMADFCQRHKIPALALTASSNAEERRQAIEKLHKRDINIIFTVDLYNEGVDLPFLDTVLFLRPTESLTVFLQQLGRGLRRCDEEDKACLSVFDFVAAQHAQFNYTQRFEALSKVVGQEKLKRHIREGFQDLPAGCAISLEKQAAQIILDNITQAQKRLTARHMANELRRIRRANNDRPLSLAEMMYSFHLKEPDALYSKKRIPSQLQSLGTNAEHHESQQIASFETQLANGMRRLLLQTDGNMLTDAKRSLEAIEFTQRDVLQQFYSILWYGDKKPGKTLEETHQFVLQLPGVRRDLQELISWVCEHRAIFVQKQYPVTSHLQLHASYTREQILQALGLASFEQPIEFREGVKYLKDRKLYILLCDIEKSESDFSPLTMYEDYAISDTLFHWQTQHSTSPTTPTGQSYIHHKRQGITVMLFIRQRKKNDQGVFLPYTFLGPVHYLDHVGSRPMSIRWRLENPIPAAVLEWAKHDLL